MHMTKANFMAEQPPVKIINSGDMVQIFICLHPEYASRSWESVEGVETVEHCIIYDYNCFKAPASLINTDDVLKNPEKYLEYYDIESAEKAQAELTAAVQRHMDTKAMSRGYDSILSACSYIGSGTGQFDKEGAAAREWRSAVWQHCYGVLADVKAGAISIPTKEMLLSSLPELEW